MDNLLPTTYYIGTREKWYCQSIYNQGSLGKNRNVKRDTEDYRIRIIGLIERFLGSDAMIVVIMVVSAFIIILTA